MVRIIPLQTVKIGGPDENTQLLPLYTHARIPRNTKPRHHSPPEVVRKDAAWVLAKLLRPQRQARCSYGVGENCVA